MKNLNEILTNSEIFRINRLDAKSDHIIYDSLDNLNKDNQIYYQLLNGKWKFSCSIGLESRPKDFYQLDYDVSGWGEIEVPSHIELSGYGQIQYINTLYPWDGISELRPPEVDFEKNQVGSYVTFFDLPKEFNDEVYISFKGVEVAFSLFLNGHFIGYAEDSFTPSDFDLSKYIKKTGNKLAVEVYQRSSASWLEDQDFFRFSGIFRDVVLYTRPKNTLDDLWITHQVINDFKDAKIKIKIKSKDFIGLNLQIFDINEQKIFDKKINFKSEIINKVEDFENDIDYLISEDILIENVDLWDILKPNLYTLIFEFVDDNSKPSGYVKQRVGFRDFQIKNKVMYLNDKRLIINGVNRHEWSAYSGRAISKEDMENDLKIMIENNITAVRTSHYPNNSYWYQLCDEYGIIVMDETNLETHGSWQKNGLIDPSWNIPGSIDSWQGAVIDRAVSMFERDKNHSSILWWSLGNESYAGTCILRMAEYFRKKDSSRLVHYEGSVYTEEFHDCTDIFSKMYPSPDEIIADLEKGIDKPYILCEYMHSMGNSVGGMEHYIDIISKYDSFQGGFIWDFKDQALYHKVNDEEVLGYGGDFLDRPSDYNFSANGLVFANRELKPAMQEVKYWYQSEEKRIVHDEINQDNIKNTWPHINNQKSDDFKIIYGDGSLGVQGNNFRYIFSYVFGGPVSLVINNNEWIDQTFKPVYWRAYTENDNAAGFLKSSGIWSSISSYAKHSDYKIDNTVSNQVTITYYFDAYYDNQTTVSYTIYSSGLIKVDVKYNAENNIPDMACFGLRFKTTQKIKNYQYLGYSNETYPDRFKGGVFGLHEEKVANTEYLVPQENSCHSYSSEVKILNDSGNILKITAVKDLFHFSVLNNTFEELESAKHQYELAKKNNSVISVYAKMRGVGGINTWGHDVEKAYHIKGTEDIELSFYLSFE